jgi:hypothetical protein
VEPPRGLALLALLGVTLAAFAHDLATSGSERAWHQRVQRAYDVIVQLRRKASDS